MKLRMEPESGARLAAALEELIPAEPYLAYSNFDPIRSRPGALFELHREWWLRVADGETVLVARDQDGRPLAAAAWEDRPFESQHFGMSMAKISPPLSVPDDDRRLPALRALYRECFAWLQQRGYQHVAATASTSDRSAGWALQELRGFYVGTRISWMQHLDGKTPPANLAPNLRIETYEGAAIAGIERGAWQRLWEWCATSFDRGPYVLDLQVPRDRAMAVYQVWTEKALRGEWADIILVVRDGFEIVAFHSMLPLPELSRAAGVGIVGRGIGATLPGYPGLFTALQKQCAATRPLGASYLENETQASTIQSIQVFGKLGHRCIRSLASFHARLDGAVS